MMIVSPTFLSFAISGSMTLSLKTLGPGRTNRIPRVLMPDIRTLRELVKPSHTDAGDGRFLLIAIYRCCIT